MTRTLLEANLRNDADKLVEVEKLLGEIRAGWKGIESQVERGNAQPVHNEIGATARVYG